MISRIMDMLNDLRPKQIFLLAGGATLLMFTAVYLALYTLTQREEAAPLPVSQEQESRKPVVVVRQDISAHTVLREDMLQVREMPEELVPPGALTTVRAAAGRAAGVSLYAGDVVTEQKTHGELLPNRFADSIPTDCRAVSVGIGSVTGVAGFAKAGDYVDVILVQKNENSAVSRLILQNVLLLSINKNRGEETASHPEMPQTEMARAQMQAAGEEDPAIATLALKPGEVMELVSADALGEIYLALRPSRPKEMWVAETDHTVYGMAKPAAPAPAAIAQTPAPAAPAPAPPAEKPASGGFEIIQGDQIVQK